MKSTSIWRLPPDPARRRGPHLNRIVAIWDRVGATAILGLVGIVFLLLWGSVLLGSTTLVPGDILYLIFPFNQVPGAHSPWQGTTSDLVLVIFPWFTVVRESLLSGHLPLWNPYAFGGSPLLGNGQSAPLSPFTLLALPFNASHGMSLMMLARLWVAGTGTYLFIRQLRAGARAALIGGIAFATCSFMVVWLGWPMTSVAALIPFGFAAVERYHRVRSRRALTGFALVVGLQFLGGHIETSIHFAGALALYAIFRAASAPSGRRARAVSLALAGMVGLLLAAAALLPLVSELRLSGIIGLRATSRLGFEHLAPETAISWLSPNRLGNPAIDGYTPDPNYNEVTAFATVTALLLSPFGLFWLWRRARGAAGALAVIGLIAVGIAYGPLAPIIGRVPLLSESRNGRATVIICFIVAVLGGLGVQYVEDRWRPRAGAVGGVLVGLGALALGGLVFMVSLVFARRGAVDTLLPRFHYIGFWVVVAGLSALGATTFILAGAWRGASRVAVAGLAAMVVAEAALFAGPYNAKVSPNDAPPQSAAMLELHRIARDRPVAAVVALLPETLTLYKIHDEGGYDAFVPNRVSLYWSHADPGYVYDDQRVNLHQPGVNWLAAVGVAYVVTLQGAPYEGTEALPPVQGVVFHKIPDARPFAYVAPGIVRSRSADESARLLGADPTGPVIVEGCCDRASAGPASPFNAPVTALPLLRQRSEYISGDVILAHDSLVVVDQTYTPDWVARVDGKQVPIHPANVMLQSVEVAAGRHHVELSYEPAAVSLGLALSALGVLGLMALLWLPLRSSRPRPPRRRQNSRRRRHASSVWPRPGINTGMPSSMGKERRHDRQSSAKSAGRCEQRPATLRPAAQRHTCLPAAPTRAIRHRTPALHPAVGVVHYDQDL